MTELTVKMAGADRPVMVVDEINVEEAVRQLFSSDAPLAVDVETTGLDRFGVRFELRMVQVATAERAWVFPDPMSKQGVQRAIRDVLASRPVLLAHNASFDLVVLDRFGLVDLEEAWGRMVDTSILSRLLDPRSKQDGAVGHNLENLCAHYLGDPDAHLYANELAAHVRAEGWSRSEGFLNVSTSEPIFHRYGAADVLATCWLFEALRPLIAERGFTGLSSFEHDIARLMCTFERRGLGVDLAYAPRLRTQLEAQQADANRVAATFGVENVNSGAQVSAALVGLGAPLSKKTASGKLATSKDVLDGLSRDAGPVGALSRAVRESKTAGGNITKYVDKVVDSIGFDGRCHANISALRARTGRMSVSNPALQQIPSGDWRLRRLFVAPSAGHIISAVDYDQIELRVVGGLAQDKAILAAVRDGVDLHSLTSERVGIERKLAKRLNFLAVYGGGANQLATSVGISVPEATRALEGFWSAYPAVKRYSAKIQRATMGGKYPVVTPTGRELPVDRSRVYAALNYVIQSTARDAFCQGLLNVQAAGLAEHCLLPVHDEVLFETVPGDAADVGAAISEAMSLDVLGTHLSASAEVGGRSWGHLYMTAEDNDGERADGGVL